ncbi:MAG: molecular chaperone HscC, partial [Planctomycetota bacterium]|nr:molecular chaperone HscC [Planctomycetota bacterium]
DLNGILEVEAYVPGGGRKFQAVLNHQSSGLSNNEIREAVKRMQAIKFYPRDDLRNQRLVLFCERLVGEVGVDDRDRLESALDLFEQAMSSGDRDRFSEARQLLIHLLLGLGIADPEPDVEEES